MGVFVWFYLYGHIISDGTLDEEYAPGIRGRVIIHTDIIVKCRYIVRVNKCTMAIS